jgi:hypothetical protein
LTSFLLYFFLKIILQRAITQAKSLEEIASLERALKLGIVPENLPDDAPATETNPDAVMDTS